MALKTSVSGTALRVKLENWRGSAPLKISHATVALSAGFLSSGLPSPKPSTSFTPLTFGGAAGTTVPIGGMVWSDPLPYTVTANKYLLVSYQLANSVPTLPEHSWANTATEYVSQPGTGDHTADPDSTLDVFVHNGYYGWHTDILTEVDVATAGVPTLAVVGDGLIDAGPGDGESGGGKSVRLSDVLGQAAPTTASPFGTVSSGMKANELMRDDPRSVVYNGRTYTAGGPSLLSRIDRDVLSLPGLKTVVINQGLSDVLHGRTAADLVTTGYPELLSYIQGRHIDVTMFGLTPCAGYAGEGAAGTTSYDPCTDGIDDQRQMVNGELSERDNPFPSDVSAYYYLNSDDAVGIANPTTGRVALDPNAAFSDRVNLTNAGFAALASANLGATDTWLLDDLTGSDTASDTASDTRNPFLTGAGANPLSTTTGASSVADTTFGNVLSLDGATGRAATTIAPVNTAKSFSLSAWVKAADLTADRTIAAQNGTTGWTYRLEYRKADNAWEFVTTSADVAAPTQYQVRATAGPAAGTWTHLTVTYNSTTRTASLYVNGVQSGTATVPALWQGTGSFALGRGSGWFKGQLSTAQVWGYALSPTQVEALFRRVR
ncbi:MAG: LamG-like jellyroll fold domain-containing protein [Kineosporiaceae bacterium]